MQEAPEAEVNLADELEELASPMIGSGQASFVMALANKAIEAAKHLRSRNASPPPDAVCGACGDHAITYVCAKHVALTTGSAYRVRLRSLSYARRVRP